MVNDQTILNSPLVNATIRTQSSTSFNISMLPDSTSQPDDTTPGSPLVVSQVAKQLNRASFKPPTLNSTKSHITNQTSSTAMDAGSNSTASSKNSILKSRSLHNLLGSTLHSCSTPKTNQLALSKEMECLSMLYSEGRLSDSTQPNFPPAEDQACAMPAILYSAIKYESSSTKTVASMITKKLANIVSTPCSTETDENKSVKFDMSTKGVNDDYEANELTTIDENINRNLDFEDETSNQSDAGIVENAKAVNTGRTEKVAGHQGWLSENLY